MSDKKDEVPKSPEEQHGEHANAVDAMNRGMIIPGDVVNKATQDLPDDQRSAIRGMHAYAVDNKLSNAEVGRLLDFTDAVISGVFRGKYPAGVANVAKAMKNFLSLIEKRKEGKALAFVKTELYTQEIEPICNAAIQFQKIAYMFGDFQIGKSECLKYYQRTHNHGSTIYVEMPTGGALCYFLAKLAEALRIGSQSREVDLRRRILESFDDRMLLIVDEADRAIPDKSQGVPKTAIKCFDFIAELFNEKSCGVVVCGNESLRKALTTGAVVTLMKKCWRRRLCAKELPAQPSRKDLNTFAGAWGLPPSADTTRKLEEKVIEDEALGVWLTTLRMAAVLAKQRNQKMKWDHVHLAYDGLCAMAKSA